MRFDDRLTTVLKGSLPEGQAAATQWRQVVDLLAQKPGNLANHDVQAGLTRLRDLHDRVSEQDRLVAVQSLKGRLRSAPLLVFLTADSDVICDAAMDAADLTPEIFEDALPRLSPRARARLQSQGLVAADDEPDAPSPISEECVPVPGPDRDGEAAIESPEEGPVDSAEELAESQISALVEKMADYQKNRPVEAAPLAVDDEGQGVFRFFLGHRFSVMKGLRFEM